MKKVLISLGELRTLIRECVSFECGYVIEENVKMRFDAQPDVSALQERRSIMTKEGAYTLLGMIESYACARKQCEDGGMVSFIAIAEWLGLRKSEIIPLIERYHKEWNADKVNWWQHEN